MDTADLGLVPLQRRLLAGTRAQLKSGCPCVCVAVHPLCVATVLSNRPAVRWAETLCTASNYAVRKENADLASSLCWR